MGYDLSESGVPVIDPARCEGCGQCARICPSDVLVMAEGRPRVTPGGFSGCIACGHCEMVCPTGAVTVSGRRHAPEHIIELPPLQAQATADQLEALLVRRRSIRRFKQEEIGRDLIDRIVRMTATAPMGIPPHETGVVVFAGLEKVQTLAQEACEAFHRMARFFNPVVLTLMRPVMGKARHAAMRDFIRPLLQSLVQGRTQGRDLLFYDAPLVLLFHYGPGSDEGDAMIAATYAMLAAESLGLGSCMIGTGVAIGHDKRLKARCRIPAKNKAGVALAVGHPDASFRRGVARPLASVQDA